MAAYIIRRILISIPVIWGVLTATFFAYRLIPGDPVSLMLFAQGDNPNQKAMLRHELGFDKPLPVQYLDFLKGALHFDFGSSIYTRQTVWHEIAIRFPNSLQLALAGFILAAIIGLVLGTLSALYNHRAPGLTITSFAIFGISLPGYWVGTMLALIFGVKLGWLPVAGMGGPRNLILPAVTLAIPLSSSLTRLVRSTVLQVIGMEYVRTARSKGVREVYVTFKHILRNAMIPVVTILGLILAELMGGVVIIENVFNWPGLGTLAVTAASGRDFPVIEGTVFFFALLLISANLVVDVLYAFIDPRIHYS